MPKLVTNFGLLRSVKAFFSGGIVQWSDDGRTLFMPCGAIVNTLDIDTGLPGVTIGNDDVDQSTTLARVTCIHLKTVDDRQILIVSYTNTLIKQFVLEKQVKIEDDEQLTTIIPRQWTLDRQWKSTHAAPILCMDMSIDGILLATGSADCTIKIWNLESHFCTHTLKSGGQSSSIVTCVCIVNNNRSIAGFADGRIRLWNLDQIDTSKRLLIEWHAHSSQVTGLLSIVDRNELLSISRDQTAAIFDMESLLMLRTLPLYESIESAVIVNDTMIAFAGDSGTLKLCNLKSGRIQQTSSNKQTSSIEQVLRCQHRNQYLLVTTDHNLQLISGDDLSSIKQFVGFNDEILDITIVGNDDEYAIVAANSPEMRMYRLDDWSCRLIKGHTESVLAVDTAQWDRQLFASAAKDNIIFVWKMLDDCTDVKSIATATGHTNSVSAICFCRLGKPKFLLSASNDSTLKIWSLLNKINDVDDKSESIQTLSAACTMVAHHKDITALDISPNDRLCATSSMDKTVRLWHINVDKLQLTSAGVVVGHKRGVWDVRFSPIDQVIVTASGDCTIKIFALVDRSCVKTFEGHSSAVLQVQFLSNGRQLISADSGGLMKLWTIHTNECIKTIEAHNDKVWALLPTNDHTKLITGGSDAVLHLWEDISEKERIDAERKRAENVAHEQALTNLVDSNRHADALVLALRLARPYSALKIVDKIIEIDDENETMLHKVVAQLRIDQLAILLEYVSQWNTNSRTSSSAQRILHHIFASFTPDFLLKLPNMRELLIALLPYTERHYDRLNRIAQQSSFIKYIWQQTRLSTIDRR